MTLHDHGHSHGSHGHSHGDSGHGHSHDESGRDTPKSGHSGFSLTSIAESTKSQDINIRAAMVHVIGDLLQVRSDQRSLIILKRKLLVNWRFHCISSDLSETRVEDRRSNLYFCFQVFLLNLLVKFHYSFSIFVICTTIPIMKDTIKILMHAAPSHINRPEMVESMMQIKVSVFNFQCDLLIMWFIQGVLMVHEMKIWTLTNDKTVVTCHLAIGNSIPPLWRSNSISSLHI